MLEAAENFTEQETGGDSLRLFFGPDEPPGLRAVRVSRLHGLSRDHWRAVRLGISSLAVPEGVTNDCGVPVVRIGDERTLPPDELAALRRLVTQLAPWRKGPFSLCGEYIDSEWRSDLKWNRIKDAIPQLSGLRVCDIGCSNGYYLFRATAHGTAKEDPPEFLLGIDPSEAFFFAFQLFQRFLKNPRLRYELLGIEHLEYFREAFDVALCLGVVYHQRDPLRALQLLRGSLREGGVAIVESQSIPGEGSVALFTPERYAKAHNVYFVPTRDCLVSWLKRAGFSKIEIISETPVTAEEQRKTPLMQFESLADYLDPADPSKTVEGFPAPWRTAVRAVRG